MLVVITITYASHLLFGISESNTSRITKELIIAVKSFSKLVGSMNSSF